MKTFYVWDSFPQKGSSKIYFQKDEIYKVFFLIENWSSKFYCLWFSYNYNYIMIYYGSILIFLDQLYCNVAYIITWPKFTYSMFWTHVQLIIINGFDLVTLLFTI